MTHQASWAGGTLNRKGSDRSCVSDLTARNFFVEEGRGLEVVVGVTQTYPLLKRSFVALTSCGIS